MGRRVCTIVVDVLILQQLYIFYLVVKSALMGHRVKCIVCYVVLVEILFAFIQFYYFR